MSSRNIASLGSIGASSSREVIFAKNVTETLHQLIPPVLVNLTDFAFESSADPGLRYEVNRGPLAAGTRSPP
ncbi:MAG: hypothetical protein WA797_03620 [Acidimicrobiales bacterium]